MTVIVKHLGFDLSQMGDADRRNLCSTFLKSVKAFSENPENVKRFEEWKRKKGLESHISTK